ncbi:hypothetical protein D3C72_1783660 [compost metagenome]
MMVLKQNRNMITASSVPPQLPSVALIAAWVSCTPFSSAPGTKAPDSSTISAVPAHTIMVSMNTPNIWIRPCDAG